MKRKHKENDRILKRIALDSEKATDIAENLKKAFPDHETRWHSYLARAMRIRMEHLAKEQQKLNKLIGGSDE